MYNFTDGSVCSTSYFITEEADGGDEAVQQAPHVDDVSVARLQLQLDGLRVVAEHVIHVAAVLAAVPPPELLDHQRPVAEDGEVAGPAVLGRQHGGGEAWTSAV